MPVSEPRETSFYEVSLTNRQVMVAFAFLLVGLLVAFLSGVWVGKTASPPAIVQEAALRVVEQEPATTAGEPAPGAPTSGPGTGAWPSAASADDPGDAVPRLDYFQESEAQAASDGVEPAGEAPAAEDAPAAVEPAAASPLRAESAASPERAAAPPSSQPAPGPQAAETRAPSPQPAAPPPVVAAAGAPQGNPAQQKPKWQQRRELANEAERLESEFAREEAELEGAPAASGARPAAPLPAGARSPAPTLSTSPQAIPPAPAPTPPVTRPTGTQFLVQVFSSPDPVKAREMLTLLQDAGYPASLSRSELASGVTYRVRIGPYRDRPAAQKVADDVQRKMRVDTWITTE